MKLRLPLLALFASLTPTFAQDAPPSSESKLDPNAKPKSAQATELLKPKPRPARARRSNKAMPEGLGGTMAPQDFLDLIEFLASLKSAPAKP